MALFLGDVKNLQEKIKRPLQKYVERAVGTELQILTFPFRKLCDSLSSGTLPFPVCGTNCSDGPEPPDVSLVRSVLAVSPAPTGASPGSSELDKLKGACDEAVPIDPEPIRGLAGLS